MVRLWRLLALPFFLGILLLAAYLYFYLGAYRPVVIQVVHQPQLPTLFRLHKGAYHQINNVIVAVETWAKENQISCTRTFGEYLDDPRQTEEARLKSNAGCILDQTLNLSSLPDHFQLGSLPAGRYVQAEFSGSPAIGPWKVYPKISAFIAEQQLKTSTTTIEIYTIDGDGKMRTQYLVPILN